MFAGIESIIAAQKSFFEMAQAVSQKTLEGSERIAALNFAAAKAALTEGNDQTSGVMSSKDPMQAMQAGLGLVQPAAEKLAAYAKHLYEINSYTSAEVSALVKKQAEVSQDLVNSAFEAAAKAAPAGSEPVFAAARNAFSAAKGAMEQAVTAGNQVADKVAEFTKQASVTSIKSKSRKAA